MIERDRVREHNEAHRWNEENQRWDKVIHKGYCKHNNHDTLEAYPIKDGRCTNCGRELEEQAK